MNKTYTIEKVEPAEQGSDKLWRLTALGLGSICIDAHRPRPNPGDTMVVHTDEVGNMVYHVEIKKRS